MNVASGQPGPLQPGEFQPLSQADAVSFGFEKLSPPTPLYIQRDDVLLIRASTSNASASIRVNFRMLLASGTVLRGQQVFPLTGNRAENDFEISLAEGYLLGVSVDDGTTPPSVGQEYVEVMLFSGMALTGFNLSMLCAGYLSGFNHLSWPVGINMQPGAGPGWLHTTQVSNPAAGADWIFTVPAFARMRIISIVAQLVAANAGTPRAVEAIVDDGTNVVSRIAANATQAINTTALYSMGQLGTPSTAVATDLQVNLPGGLVLTQNMRIRTNTVNINAGDQWSAIWLFVEEWTGR